MLWSDIPWRPPHSTLRWFAAIWLACFVGLGCMEWFLHANGTGAIALVFVALLIGPLGLIYPAAIRGVFVSSLVITFPLGWLISRLLLGIVFYCLFTPLGLFFRLVGRDPLGRHLQPGAASYWSPKPQPEGIRSYFHQS